MKNKKLIPFTMLPFSWGMTGKTREIAQAEYEYSGMELDLKLLDINKDTISDDLYKQRNIEIKFKYNEISESQYYRSLVELIKDDTKRKIATLELDFKEGKITQLRYEKETAIIKNEPWVAVVKMHFNEEKPDEGSFELDWNDQFVKSLEDAGYVGHADNIVNLWFVETCRNVALDTYDGQGEFNEQSQQTLDSQEAELPKGRRAY